MRARVKGDAAIERCGRGAGWVVPPAALAFITRARTISLLCGHSFFHTRRALSSITRRQSTKQIYNSILRFISGPEPHRSCFRPAHISGSTLLYNVWWVRVASSSHRLRQAATRKLVCLSFSANAGFAARKALCKTPIRCLNWTDAASTHQYQI